MRLFQMRTVGYLLLVLVQAAGAAGKPTLRVSADGERIAVEASDPVGLDSLEIACPEADSTYRTQMTGPAPGRELKRSFALRDLFPEVRDWSRAVRLTVTIRNTRGATASSSLTVRPISTDK